MDIGFAQVAYAFLLMLGAGATWVAREILLPWSHAKLKQAETEQQKAEATTKLVDVLAKEFPNLAAETKNMAAETNKQNAKLDSIVTSASSTAESLSKIQSDQVKLCHAGPAHCKASMTEEAFQGMITKLQTLIDQGSQAAVALKAQAELARGKIAHDAKDAVDVVTNEAKHVAIGLKNRS